MTYILFLILYIVEIISVIIEVEIENKDKNLIYFVAMGEIAMSTLVIYLLSFVLKQNALLIISIIIYIYYIYKLLKR